MRSRRRTVATHAIAALTRAFVAMALGACSVWTGVTPASAQRLAAAEPRHVRLNLRDGSQVTLKHARTVGDSMVGRGSTGERSAVATNDVVAARVRHFDLGYNVVVLGWVALIVTGAAYLFAGG